MSPEKKKRRLAQMREYSRGPKSAAQRKAQVTRKREAYSNMSKEEKDIYNYNGRIYHYYLRFKEYCINTNQDIIPLAQMEKIEEFKVLINRKHIFQSKFQEFIDWIKTGLKPNQE